MTNHTAKIVLLMLLIAALVATHSGSEKVRTTLYDDLGLTSRLAKSHSTNRSDISLLLSLSFPSIHTLYEGYLLNRGG
jgi:hypothetical protein